MVMDMYNKLLKENNYNEESDESTLLYFNIVDEKYKKEEEIKKRKEQQQWQITYASNYPENYNQLLEIDFNDDQYNNN